MVKYLRYLNDRNLLCYANISNADYCEVVQTANGKYAIDFSAQRLATSENVNIFQECYTNIFHLASFDTKEAAEAKLNEIMISRDEFFDV